LLRKVYFLLAIAALPAGRTLAQASGSNARTNTSDPRSLANQYLRQNKLNEAEIAFVQAIKVDPADVLNYGDLAILYLAKNNYAKAETTAAAGLRIKPADIYIRSVLAKVFLQKGDAQNATRQLDEILKGNPRNIFAWCALATMAKDPSLQKKYLLKALSFSNTNIAIRLRMAELSIDQKNIDSAVFFLQSIKKGSPDFSPGLTRAYNALIQSLRGNDATQINPRFAQFHDLLALHGAYIAAVAPLNGPQLSSGYAGFTSSPNMNQPVAAPGTFGRRRGFADATTAIGLDAENSHAATRSVVAVTDYTPDGEMYLYTSTIIGGKQRCHLQISKLGGFEPVPGDIDHAAKDNDAAFIDYDNDGYPDLFVATTNGILLYKNNGDGKFTAQKNDIGLSAPLDIQKMLFADFDQDGDLDIYVSATGGNKFFRNNGNGTFTEQANAMGLAITGSAKMDFADYDQDGDLDIIAASETNGPTLFNNERHSKFKNTAAGLRNARYNGKAAAFADYNNDGLPDLFLSGSNGQQFLLKNVNGDHFVVDAASKTLTTALHDIDVADAIFLDYDNDGYEDLLVAGTTGNASVRAVQLFHNDGGKGFSNATDLLPASAGQATQIAIADFNGDGDDDIFLAGPGGVRLIRNDLGSSNHFMQVELSGLSYGGNKNNRAGIGAQIELKAGGLYQLKTVRRYMTNFGLGAHQKPEAARIIWPNGTPQYIEDPTAGERLAEEEILKGSCPFLFAWDGSKYTFLKDMMWRSALGMPLAINGSDTTYAYSGPSKEYLLIPGQKLKPKNNTYSIKITEELWEAVYFDKVTLTAVDHPDSVDIFADERMIAPPYPGARVYSVANKNHPVSAADNAGNDVLKKIESYDFQYVTNLDPGRYQGLTEDHDLILDLGEKAVSDDSLYLFLRGWTFPADASINMAMAQSDSFRQRPPSLQVIDPQGQWQTVIPDIGYPMGKDKMVVVNLSGKFLTQKDRRIRIRTNMQVYWDEIFFSTCLSKSPVTIHPLHMNSAGLAYRGYSAMYRKGGPFGPHWFDYYKVTHGQKWRDLTGHYTRYGDVLPLLKQADDEYIIAAGGDQVSIDFDATRLPPLPKGWRRDFLLYSEGWVKDGDLNTAYGQTVAPLPFHEMPAYPYSGGVAYPLDAKHRRYLKEYNTRLVNTNNFKNAIREP